MKIVEFTYDLFEKVRIKGLDNICGFVVNLWYSEVGMQYRVVYYCDGERKMEYFFGFELDVVRPVENVGFKV